MSVPARRLDRGAPTTDTSISASRRPAAPARATAARPRTSSPPQVRRRARRGLHPTFLAFASVVTVALVVGVVALNALLAQTAFAVHGMQSQVSDLHEQRDVLATQAAELSSPSRIAKWASRYHMVLPTTVVILHVPTAPSRTLGAP